MIISELTVQECHETLARLKFGRLACSHDDQPYVVPTYFIYHEKYLYCFCTVGQKIEWMRANPLVCVEADEVLGHNRWTCVILEGRYEELQDAPEGHLQCEVAHDLLQQRASWWEPAYVGTAHLPAVPELTPVYYRIRIDQISGRRAKPNPVELIESETTHKNESRLQRILRKTPFARRHSSH